MLQWVHHVPVWIPAELPVDAEGNTQPGFICAHELENGCGPCGGNVFSTDQEVGDHACLVDEGLGPLSFTDGLCGLGRWVDGPKIEAWGNLAERGYSVEDVVEHLRRLIKVAPSLDVRVHCGGDYESSRVIATITTGCGMFWVSPPNMQHLWWSFDDEDVV